MEGAVTGTSDFAHARENRRRMSSQLSLLVGEPALQRRVRLKKKRGAWQLPVFSFSVCRRLCRRHLRRRAPQKRCVNGCQNSRPGGVILSPFRALATTIRFYSRATPGASENFNNPKRAGSSYFCLGSLCVPPPWPPSDRSTPPPVACCVACDCGA